MTVTTVEGKVNLLLLIEPSIDFARDEFVQLAIAGGEKSKLGHRYETVFEHAEGLFCNNTYRFCHGKQLPFIHSVNLLEAC
jgi:hypothetical protein